MPDVVVPPLSDLTSLRGRVAVVTGGAQGIGRAIANRLAEAGASVAIADRNGDAASSVARAIAEEHGVRAHGIAVDVADGESVDRAATLVVSELGGLDVWVNNAGLFPSAPLDVMSDDDWDRVFAVNVRGVRNGIKAAAARMGESGGVVVNIASLAAFEGTAPGLSAYVSSKHAVRGLTRQAAIELAPRGIRVLGVAPTFVMTEGTMAAGAATMQAAQAAGEGVPSMPAPATLIGRQGTADDIARVALFCASNLSAVMTGSTLLADAGATA
ncbi:SDR family NAD(P)-dependent oxidoreductase [Demequina sp. NBRC 110057]|uniref:SDR family NAD(P)-dependent oxidoreductase n=1 Tax=Demequina sp. NBRC 110057 TaxID=1570346 RepID=UPI000A044C3A|nr:SDR family NAD(P)-dependent oxidoreductase [Demequina sp. NBRC 110057]